MKRNLRRRLRGSFPSVRIQEVNREHVTGGIYSTEGKDRGENLIVEDLP